MNRCELDTVTGGVCLGRVTDGRCEHEDRPNWHHLHCPLCGATFGNDRAAANGHTHTYVVHDDEHNVVVGEILGYRTTPEGTLILRPEASDNLWDQLPDGWYLNSV